MMGFYLLLPMNVGLVTGAFVLFFFRGFYDFFTIFIAAFASPTLFFLLPL